MQTFTISRGQIVGNRNVFSCCLNSAQYDVRLLLIRRPATAKLLSLNVLCVNAGVVHSVSGWTRGVQVKLWDPLRTRAIPERLRGVFTTRRCTNPHSPLPLITTHVLSAADWRRLWSLSITWLMLSAKYVGARADNNRGTRLTTLTFTRHRTESLCNWRSTCFRYYDHISVWWRSVLTVVSERGRQAHHTAMLSFSSLDG